MDRSPTRALATHLIRTVKRDPTYEIHDGISTLELISEVVRRGTALLRAQFKLLGVRGGRIRFVEPGVVIQSRRRLTVGRGTVLERGVLLRCLSEEGFSIGQNVTIGRYSIVEATGVLWHLSPGFSIGDNSSLGDWSFVGCGGGVQIGNNVLVGQRLSVHSQNHRFGDHGKTIRSQGVTSEGVTIEDDCWIGSGVTVLDGVTIGSGSVVAAGSVVTRSCSPGSIIGGNPARLIRSRDDTRDPAADAAH